MTREDIIAMAIEVYGSVHEDDFKFATLVASAERKACADVIKENWRYTADAEEMVYYILERGQA